ncbi:GNAT family N-acetyltransferase [Kitasatospora sp. NPDC089913]|uniref:GNAT family N-acetyltransferase n=1 Tax=Kitasatospora sp. NPDC089913 TaxID=3364080 RepID=UPI0037F8C5DC
MKMAYVHHEGKAYAYLRYEPDVQSVAILAEVHVLGGYQGRGWGSELLRQITADADASGVVLMLSVEPGPEGLTRNELTAWYSRYGWEPVRNEAREVEPDILCRLPHAAM